MLSYAYPLGIEFLFSDQHWPAKLDLITRVLPLVPFETKSLFAGNIRAGKRRTPEFLDMLYDEIGTGEMVDTRWSLRVVHGIRHVPHQGHVLANLDHLANRERSTQHTHVEMHATKNDIVDFPFREQVIGLLPVVGQCIARCHVDEFVLAFPCLANLALLTLATATHVGVIDGKNAFASPIRPAPGSAPTWRS